MRIIDLLNMKLENKKMPKLIKIMWLDYEVKYYLDDEFWYRDINNDEPLKINPNQLNIEVEILEDKPKKIEKMELFDLTIKDEENELGYTGVADTIDTIYCKLDEIIDGFNYLLEKSNKDEK